MAISKKIDFIVIGPGKSGTSWLFNVLGQHPEVCLSSAKETLYFEKYFAKGENWYHNFFSPANEQQLSGEISNTYIFDHAVPKRIHDYRPDIKLITTLRNPVDRTFSHYLFMLRIGEFTGTFEEALEQRPDLITRGNYNRLLEAYDAYFKADQILCLLFEELKSNNTQYIKNLLQFLNLKHLPEQDLLDEKVLSAGKARNTMLSKMVKKMADFARDAGYAELVTKVKFNKGITKYIYKEFKPGEKPKMSAETKAHLQTVFFEDAQRLSDRLNKDMVAYWDLKK